MTITRRRNRDKLIDSAIGVAGVCILALIGWGAKVVSDLQAKVGVLENRLADRDRDEEQRITVTLRKHWKLHTWARDELTDVEKKLDMPISHWPELPD